MGLGVAAAAAVFPLANLMLKLFPVYDFHSRMIYWHFHLRLYKCFNAKCRKWFLVCRIYFFLFFFCLPFSTFLQHFPLFSAAKKLLKDCRGSKSKCKTENKTSGVDNSNSSKETQMYSGEELELAHKSKLVACSTACNISCDPLWQEEVQLGECGISKEMAQKYGTR